MMRVLLSAYACEPGRGSEEGIGWNWVRQVARRNDCVLLTRENNVEAIRAAARTEGLDRLEVVGFDLPFWMRFWKRKGRGAMLYFYMWQLALRFPARRLDKQHDFDLVHHVTFASSWIPSGLAFVGKPFIWGPVGQHPRIPARFLQQAPLSTRLSESLKAAVKGLAVRLDPFLRVTVRRARRILSLGSEFERCADLLSRRPVERFPACGVDRIHRGESSGNRILFAGRLVALKGPTLALSAFARALPHCPDMQLTFLGDGPLRRQLEISAGELGVAHAVTFAGALPFEQALDVMTHTEVLLFPSFEGAGMVVPEAMASGAVVLCLDFGGPGDMTIQGRGLAVPVGETEDETIDSLADGLQTLLGDPTLRTRIRTEAEDWIRSEMLWDRKGDRIQGIYESVLQEQKGEGS